MSYIPITPFGRPVDATLIAHEKQAAAPYPSDGINKWDVLRELTVAKDAFGLSPRTLSVLQALLSFHRETILDGNNGPLVVFPSNAAICDRLHGMACSTMRRHLAALVTAGFLLRRDSPNGKRYIKRYGTAPQAFGFDLSPLLTRFAEIMDTADATRAAEAEYQHNRRTVSLMRRDLAALTDYGLQTQPDVRKWDALDDMARLTARALRRTLQPQELEVIKTELEAAITVAKALLDIPATREMSTSDCQNEQHSQRSKKEEYIDEKNDGNEQDPAVSVTTVLNICKEFKAYIQHDARCWPTLIQAAQTVGPMMGITKEAWLTATKAMGSKEAAFVLLAMLERFDQIKSPAAYLTHLTKKAGQGAFSCKPMLRSLQSSQL